MVLSATIYRGPCQRLAHWHPIAHRKTSFDHCQIHRLRLVVRSDAQENDAGKGLNETVRVLCCCSQCIDHNPPTARHQRPQTRDSTIILEDTATMAPTTRNWRRNRWPLKGRIRRRGNLRSDDALLRLGCRVWPGYERDLLFKEVGLYSFIWKARVVLCLFAVARL